MAKTAKKAKAQDNGSSPVFDEVQRFYEFMQQNKLETLEFNKDDMHVKLVRKRSPHVPVPVPVSVSGHQPARQEPATHAPAAPPAIKGSRIKTPMTGIFYRAPSPSSPPFVKEGDTVHAGQVVCIVEAMKVFNEIKAETDCVVTKVLVENGKPVTANQELFAIEKK